MLNMVYFGCVLYKVYSSIKMLSTKISFSYICLRVLLKWNLIWKAINLAAAVVQKKIYFPNSKCHPYWKSYHRSWSMKPFSQEILPYQRHWYEKTKKKNTTNCTRDELKIFSPINPINPKGAEKAESDLCFRLRYLRNESHIVTTDIIESTSDKKYIAFRTFWLYLMLLQRTI